ncbi:MAG: rRNA maturation RNase YbeY [bacterium]|nr:rRNA maturation RNase YbeY [bacterium]
MAVAIKNLTRQHLKVVAGAVFSAVAEEVLPGWDVSLVFVGATRAKALNKKLRGKTYVPNVLSYVVGEKSAEIIICPSEAAKQAPSFNLTPYTFTLYLFIHGALHIKGWAHGARMETCERNLLARYEATHSYRHRHRHVPSKDGRRRGALR